MTKSQISFATGGVLITAAAWLKNGFPDALLIAGLFFCGMAVLLFADYKLKNE